MHNYETELSRYIRGEIREQGWKSDWRRKIENMFEPAAPTVAKVVHISKPAMTCSNCPKFIWRKAKSGMCKQCYAAKMRKIERRTCGTCSKELGRVNKSGFCNRHKWSQTIAA